MSSMVSAVIIAVSVTIGVFALALFLAGLVYIIGNRRGAKKVNS